MGYQTRYELDIIEGEESLIEELRGYSEEAAYALEGDGSTGGGCKWYDYRKDMCAFSLLHPDAVFKLAGAGEESEDLWEEYYHKGKLLGGRE